MARGALGAARESLQTHNTPRGRAAVQRRAPSKTKPRLAAGKDGEASAPKGGAGTRGVAAKGEQPRRPAARKGGAAAAAPKESGVTKKRIVAKGEQPRRPAARKGGAADAALGVAVRRLHGLEH